MKATLSVLFVLLGLLNWSCSPDEQVIAPTKIDYEQASRQLMTELHPQVVGNWILRQVDVKYSPFEHGQREIKLIGDSTFRNLATLRIIPAVIPRTSPVDTRQREYDGMITYGTKTYPVSFDMRANATWIVSQEGPQTFFSFQYHFPDGSHWTEPEEAFLQNIGLIDEVFTMQTTVG